MGYMRHHAIVVMSSDEELLRQAHERAGKIFAWVSAISPEAINVYRWELSSSKGLERTAMWGGLIGSLGAFSYVYEAEEHAYEEEFKSCLEEKGYLIDE